MKAEGNLSKRESSTFGKPKWKKRFGRVADEKFHIFEAQGTLQRPLRGAASFSELCSSFWNIIGDSKAKSVMDVMKANDLCKAPSVDPMVRLL